MTKYTFEQYKAKSEIKVKPLSFYQDGCVFIIKTYNEVKYSQPKYFSVKAKDEKSAFKLGYKKYLGVKNEI